MPKNPFLSLIFERIREVPDLEIRVASASHSLFLTTQSCCVIQSCSMKVRELHSSLPEASVWAVEQNFLGRFIQRLPFNRSGMVLTFSGLNSSSGVVAHSNSDLGIHFYLDIHVFFSYTPDCVLSD